MCIQQDIVARSTYAITMLDSKGEMLLPVRVEVRQFDNQECEMFTVSGELNYYFVERLPVLSRCSENQGDMM